MTAASRQAKEIQEEKLAVCYMLHRRQANKLKTGGGSKPQRKIEQKKIGVTGLIAVLCTALISTYKDSISFPQ